MNTNCSEREKAMQKNAAALAKKIISLAIDLQALTERNIVRGPRAVRVRDD